MSIKKPNFIDTFKGISAAHAIDWEKQDEDDKEEDSELIDNIFGNKNVFADLTEEKNDFFGSDADNLEEQEKESDDNKKNYYNDADLKENDNDQISAYEDDNNSDEDEYVKRLKYQGPKTARTKFAYDLSNAQNDEDIYVDLRYNNTRIAVKRNMAYKNPNIDETDPEKYKKNVLITQGEFREQLREKRKGNEIGYATVFKGFDSGNEDNSSFSDNEQGNSAVANWNFEFNMSEQDKSEDNEEEQKNLSKSEDIGKIDFEVIGGNIVSNSKQNDGKSSDDGIKPGKIKMKKLPDVTVSDQPSMCTYTCSDIHRSARLSLVATTDRRIRIYNVDGNTNPLLQSILIQNIIVTYAAFTYDGRSIVICGHGLVYFMFDLQTGKMQKRASPTFRKNAHISSLQYARLGPDFSVVSDGNCLIKNTLLVPSHNGYIYIIDLDSNIIVSTLKSPFKIETVSVYNGLTLDDVNRTSSIDSNTGVNAYMRPPAILATGVGTGGKIAVWKYGLDGSIPKTPSPDFIIVDDGSTETTRIATSPHFIACGQVSGCLNIYSSSEIIRDDIAVKLYSPKPKYTITNLKDPIISLTFNCTGELLYYSSDSTETQGRMVHVLTGSIYQNWPTLQTAINKLGEKHKELFIPLDAKFYPDSKRIQISFRGGIVSLYEISHYN